MTTLPLDPRARIASYRWAYRRLMDARVVSISKHHGDRSKGFAQQMAHIRRQVKHAGALHAIRMGR